MWTFGKRTCCAVSAFAAAVALAGCGAGTATQNPAPIIERTPAATSSPSLLPTVEPSATATARATATAVATPLATATPAPSPSPTPLAIATDSLFASVGSGIDIFSQAGTVVDTFATSTGASSIGLDDAGNVYALAAASDFTIVLARYAIGGNTPDATYAPTSARPQLILTGRNGEFVAEGAGSDAVMDATAVFDVWDPGKTGAPSRTITYPNESEVTLGGTIAADGTLYLPYDDAAGQVRYDVIPPGSAAPSRTIVESIAAAGSNFAPNVMAVAADGTLYVGEWTYETPDANAGLYVYPVSGSETKVTSGAPNPTGLDFDAAGNVYVANSSATIMPDATLSSDTQHTLSVFAPGGATLARQVATGIADPQNLAVDADGTAYLVDVRDADRSAGSIVVVPPAAAAATTFAATLDAGNVVLFDGTRVRSLRARGSAAGRGRHSFFRARSRRLGL